LWINYQKRQYWSLCTGHVWLIFVVQSEKCLVFRRLHNQRELSLQNRRS
jgi:hypothetical protein